MTFPTGLLVLFAIAIAIAAGAAMLLLVSRLRHPPRRTAGWALATGRPVDPGDLDLAHREDRVGSMPWWLVADDEATLASEASPTVVLLHGWGRSRRDMLQRMEPWRTTGHRMVLPDLRGHGDADGPSTLGTREVADLLELLEAIPAREVLLCGHSMGGVVAILAAAKIARGAVDGRPRLPKVTGVVAIAPYERLRIPAIAQLQASGVGGPRQTTPLLAVLSILGIEEPSTSAASAELDMPLLVLHGDDDRLCPIEDARRIAAAAGALGRFIAIEGGGHDDLRPETMASIEGAIRGWLEEPCTKSGGPRPIA